MSGFQIVFADNDKKGSPAWKAWRQVLPLFLNGTIREADCLHASTSGEASNNQRRIGVAITLGTNDFWKNFIQLERAGCEFFINVTDSGGTPKPWLDLEPRWRGVCMQRCSVASLKATSLAEEIKEVIKDRFPTIKPHLRPCRPVADAKELVRKLPEFSHGGALDASNIMLAPARMLCGAIVDGDRKIAWNSWARNSRRLRKEVREKLKVSKTKIDSRNLLAAELFESWEFVNQWLAPNVPAVKPADSREVLELERTMGLLTEIRLIGKGKPGNSASQSLAEESLAPIEIVKPRSEKVFRVLVVDDHARCWHSTIGLAAKLASQKLEGRVEVDFSTDAKTVISQGAADFWQVLLGYDLVLLDVYLPGGTKGTDLLAKLRKSVNWLPVIIWTSSLSSELAGSAALHNGYLFKKTSSITELSEIFAVWLPIGNARRRYSLLNPLFNQAIIDPTLRKIAVEFTLWCLKLMDGFHAVDDSYFKFFNDHGGRHVVALLEKIEQLLRPLLLKGFTDEKTGKQIPLGEKELLALYVAVLCHEFGMFPLSKKGFEHHSQSELEATRKQHALKSFFVLTDDGTEDIDDELRGLVLRLKGLSREAHRLSALISAYHSRFLSLEKEKFGRLEKDTEAVAALREADPELEEKLTSRLNSICQRVGDEEMGKARHLCAIFRFADAIEMDISRVPAPFILHAAGRADAQNREDLKRQVVRCVKIEDGLVSIHFNCPRPNHHKGAIWPWAASRKNKWSSFKHIGDGFDFLKGQNFVSHQPVDLTKPRSEIARAIKGILDDWLDTPRKHQSQERIAAVAALSVICDVVEEFDAITKVGQKTEQSIRLGQTNWGDQTSLKTMTLLPTIIKRQKSYGSTGYEPFKPHYESKFVFQSSHFARDLSKVLAQTQLFGDYEVKSLTRTKFTDIYYDEWLSDEDSFRLAAKGISCRWRKIGKMGAFEIKRARAGGKDYPKCETSAKLTDACKESELPRKVPNAVFKELKLSPRRSLLPVARIENERCCLFLVGRDHAKWVKVHLDSFRIHHRDGNGKWEFLEESQEIEVVTDRDHALMELSEILTTSFKLVKVQKSKIGRYAHALAERQARKKKVQLWLDVDTGVDDAMALLLALRSPDRCTVVGVSAVGGNVPLEKVLINSAKIIDYSAATPRPPLFSGFTPSGSKPDASNVHGEDGIGNIDEFVKSSPRPIAEQLFAGFKKTVAQHKGKEITFVATGPLTNLARLTQECPDEVRKLRHIVVMGGAFDEPGNREAQPEFNIYSDPESAQVVLEFIRNNGIRHSFVPLDVTHRVVLKRAEVEKLSKVGNTEAEFIRSLTKHYMQFYYDNQAMDGCPLHDPMAVGFALWPELFISDDFHVEIAPSNLGPFSGATSADFRPTRLFRDRILEVSSIVLRVDQERFLKRIEEKLLGRNPAIGTMTNK